jgi:hypothetical protein
MYINDIFSEHRKKHSHSSLHKNPNSVKYTPKDKDTPTEDDPKHAKHGIC